MGVMALGSQGVTSSVGSVADWLERIEIVEGESAEWEEEKPLQNDDNRKSPPCTPLQEPRLVEGYAEVSPTDTNFSYNAVFDTPDTPIDPGSPSPANYRQTHAYADTDASSVAAEEEGKTSIKANNTNNITSIGRPGDEDAASLESYDLPSEDEEHTHPTEPSRNSLLESRTQLLHAPCSPITNVVSDQPRFIWITSCLQCTLAGLPCSRTAPSCSRCKRYNRSELCLLHRRRMRHEIVNGDGDFNTTPVLLKVQGDDGDVWRRKVQTAEEMLEAWLEKQDRKNWVLPVNNGRIGDFRTCRAGVPRLHPGEGIGRMTHRELRLADA